MVDETHWLTMGQRSGSSREEIQSPGPRHGTEAPSATSASLRKKDLQVEYAAAESEEPPTPQPAYRYQDKSEYIRAMEDFFLPDPDSEHSVLPKAVAIIERIAIHKPPRVIEKGTSPRPDRNTDVIEVMMPISARERKAGTRIMLPKRFMHDQAFKELDLKVTKRFEHGVQVGPRGSVCLDVEFGSKEHVDRIVASSEEYQKRGECGPTCAGSPHIEVGADASNVDSQAAAMIKTPSEIGMERAANHASSGMNDREDHEASRSNSRTSTRYSAHDSDSPSEYSSELERHASIDVLKMHSPDQVTYIGGLSATKRLVPRQALIDSGFRILRSSETSWQAVPTETMHVGSEKGSTKAIAEGVLALSRKCREGKCVEVSVFPSCPAEIENSEEIL